MAKGVSNVAELPSKDEALRDASRAPSSSRSKCSVSSGRMVVT